MTSEFELEGVCSLIRVFVTADDGLLELTRATDGSTKALPISKRSKKVAMAFREQDHATQFLERTRTTPTPILRGLVTSRAEAEQIGQPSPEW